MLKLDLTVLLDNSGSFRAVFKCEVHVFLGIQSELSKHDVSKKIYIYMHPYLHL